jgi:peptidoglycan/LPS O-acetylase OafA/YrhL
VLQQPVTAPARPVGDAARRGELDLLRALVVVGLVFFHAAVIFGAGEFPVKAGPENRAATVLLAFGATWGMPLLFLISGMGAWYSLRSRTPAAFAWERLRRLGVPLLVGLLTLVPLQAWLGMPRWRPQFLRQLLRPLLGRAARPGLPVRAHGGP